MLQRLPIALEQIKFGNTSENLLNKIKQIMYSLYRGKDLPKKYIVYNNIMNSIKLKNRMDTIFMNSENSKTSAPHRRLLNHSDKIDLKRNDKYVALPNLNILLHMASLLHKSNKNNILMISGRTSKEEFESTDRSYSVSDIQDYFECIIKEHETFIENPPVRIYLNKMKYRIIFRIKTLLTPETVEITWKR